MIVSLIAAMNDARVIGIENRLPWHLPADLQYFKKITLGKPVLMGRKTFESIGKPLPGRLNVIVTRDRDFHIDGALTVHSIDAALAATKDAAEVMVMGGASFYEQMLPQAQRLYITLVKAPDIKGDAHFPKWNSAEWREVSREDHKADERNRYDYSFVVYERTDRINL